MSAKHQASLRQTIDIPPATVAEVQAESEAIFRSIGEGAIATDEFGRITRVNPTALKILGLRAEEAFGQWFPRVVPIMRVDGSTMPLIERPIVKMFLTGKPVTEKVLYVTKQGKHVPVSLTVSPIILSGRPVGAIQVFRDITIENEIDRMKSEFISVASHQLRTPLSAIKTYAHMLIEGYMGDVAVEQATALDTIISATNTMNELISTLLNIARMESGSIEITSADHDARRLAADIISQHRLSAEERGITLKLSQPQQPINLYTDSFIVKEVLANLVGNAIKYTLSGGTVAVQIRSTPRTVTFTVRDNGIGIPASAQHKLFTKFFRATNALKQETTGTGLGLYVVHGLVQTLHGKIWFRSEEGKGSTFYVSLPKHLESTIGATAASSDTL
jgi:PAS domain S-box-containing protein